MQIHSLKGLLVLSAAILLAFFLAPLWNKYIAATVPTLMVPGV